MFGDTALLPFGSLEIYLPLSLFRHLMERDGNRVHIASRHRFMLEVTKGVATTDQGRTIPIRKYLPGLRGNVAEDYCNAPVVAFIGLRSMGN